MKLIIPLLCFMLLFCGCKKENEVYDSGSSVPSASQSGTASNTSSLQNPSADKFKGNDSLVGRWKCMTETQNGETRDVTADEIYYVFAADGTMETFYRGTNMEVYAGYSTTDKQVTFYYGGESVTLEYSVDGRYLTITGYNGKISTVYEKVA
ncbi:MAG: hypothetical protein E7550_03720 [Ruminococcaceae bacterium]|nr:hypothetical protein [Oscillospiraceae bacterium]